MENSSQETPNSTPQFYRNLTGFNDFSEINNLENYQPVPEDWFVVITDIVGSTKAIEAGKYKEVNTLGAATISVLQKSLGTFHFPFVFGGDGATALIHSSDLAKAKEALLKLKSLAKAQFEMDLRIGAISVKEVYQAGQAIDVAKYFMNPQKSIAMIRGGGLSWADDKIKVEQERYCLNSALPAVEDLEGLSCRWQPLKSGRGKVATILIKPCTDEPNKVLKEVISKMGAIFKNDFDRACPVQNQNMQYKSVTRCLIDEWKYNSNHLSESFIRRFISILICVWAFKLKLPIFFDSKAYESSIFSHSDYKKFDDILRMVVDCSEDEIIEMEALLQNLYQEGKIFFGVHYSDHSLMTCLVENTQQGGHIHFIDGGDGGYAMAAKILKTQIKDQTHNKYAQAT